MYYNIAKSLVFAGRNNDKVFYKNDKGRIFAEVGQIGNAVSATAKLDNTVGKGTKAAIDVFCKVSKENKALDVLGKGVNIARNNVNPLLVGAAAYRVFQADDKEKAMKREIFGMCAMFGIENFMKTMFSSPKYKAFVDKIKNPTLKALTGIFQGLVFVAGSITGSTIGYKLGDFFFGKDKKSKKAENSDSAGKKDNKQETDKAKKIFQKITINPQKQTNPNSQKLFQTQNGKMIA